MGARISRAPALAKRIDDYLQVFRDPQQPPLFFMAVFFFFFAAFFAITSLPSNETSSRARSLAGPPRIARKVHDAIDPHKPLDDRILRME